MGWGLEPDRMEVKGRGLESHLQTVWGGTRTCQDGGERDGVRISPSDSVGVGLEPDRMEVKGRG